MSTKIRLFNKNFSESFQKKFNKVELQYDNENHEFIEVCTEKQIGYVYLLLQPYVTTNEILTSQPELSNILTSSQFVLSEIYGHFTDNSESKAIFPHLRLKFRDINESTTFYQTEISTSGNNVNLASIGTGSEMERVDNIFGATGSITGWTNKGNFYSVDGSAITGGVGTYYPLTFTNESYYYSGVGGTYQASIDNSEHFLTINDELTDYSYVCPTNSQLGKIWEKPVGTTTEDYGNRGIYCFGVQTGGVYRNGSGHATYGITTEDISNKPSGQNVNSVITADKPYTRASGTIFRNTPARMLGVTSISGKYIDDATYIFGSMDLALTGDSLDLKGNMPLVVTGGTGDSDPAGIVYKNCGYSASGITYNNSDTFKETDLNKMGLVNVDTETSRYRSVGKHTIFLMAIPFELQAETSNNVTTYKPVLTETKSGGAKRVVDLTQPIELDLIWSTPIKANEDGSYNDDAKSFIEENMLSANYNYLNDFDDTNRYQIQDTTDYAALVTDLEVKVLSSDLTLYDGDTEKSELATGIIPYAMKTVFLVQDDCFNGAPLNYEQNIDYIFVPDSDIKTNNKFRNFNCNPYSSNSGNIYVSMYPDFGIGIDTGGSSVQG